MWTILIIIIGLCMLVFPFMLIFNFEEDKQDEKNKRNRKRCLTSCLCVLGAVLITVSFFISYMINSRNNAIGNSIAIDIPNHEQTLFYDEEKDEYFFTQTSDWDLKNLVVRNIIDYDTGKTLKDCTEQMSDALTEIEEVLDNEW